MVSVGGGNTVHIVSKVRLNLITQEGATVSNLTVRTVEFARAPSFMLIIMYCLHVNRGDNRLFCLA